MGDVGNPGTIFWSYEAGFLLVPRLCLGMKIWRLCLHLVAEPLRLHYEAEPRNEKKNKAKAARILGVGRATLYRFLADFHKQPGKNTKTRNFYYPYSSPSTRS